MVGRPGSVLTERQLNRAVLARQLLLKRVRMPLPRVLEAVAGLQAQYAPSMYIGLWSRVEGLARRAVTEALDHRTVVQATLMRSTIHLVSADDYWPLASAVRDPRRVAWLRAQRGQVNADDMVAAAGRLTSALSEGPMYRADIQALLGRPQAGGVGLWVDLVRAPPSGTWERRRADRYALASAWLPGGRTGDPDAAIEHTVRRYLGGFGPATAADTADWAGLPVGQVLPVLTNLGGRRWQSEGGQELFDLPGALLPHADTEAPVRFLPPWEAVLLVHARHKGVLAEQHRPLLFTTKNPHSVNTFLVDGQVAGTWRFDRRGVDVQPFAPLEWAAEIQVAQEAERLAAFHA